jgi:quercetin dioxygenase-like cupin family protein
MTDFLGVDRRGLLCAAAIIVLASHAMSSALAQDAARMQPAAYRVVFENDKTRVLEFVSRPRSEVCGVGKHSHPAHLTVALTDAKVRVTLPDGKQIVATNKAGDVFWSEAETHVVENIGGADMRALIVEYKDGAKPRG